MTLGIFVAGSSAAPTSARAEVFDELLDILRTKGEITQPEYDKLKARHQAELRGGDAKRRATEAKAREAEAKAREAEAKAARPAPVSVLPTVKGPAPVDWIPQLTYKSPSYNGFTVAAGLFTPLDEVPFSGDPNSATLTGHDSPQVQGQLKYVGNIMPDLKLTLSTSGTVQRQQADCTASIPTFGTSSCIGAAPLVSSAGLSPGTSVTAWAVDGFARLDHGPVSLVATGYTGRGVGTTGLFFDGVAADGSARKSDGGYIQAGYEFFNTLTLGGSWGVSVLDTADAQDAAAEFASCRAAVATCLVHSNESWILFANYKLTTWAELQAEFVQTRAENQIGQKITDNAVLAGVTFFW